MEGAEAGNIVLTAVDMMDFTLLEMTSVNQFSFTPGHRKYMILGSREADPNLY